MPAHICYSGKAMKTVLYIFLQFTWCLPQNIVGLIVLLATPRKKRAFFQNRLITYWQKPYSLGCGTFIFLGEHGSSRNSDTLNAQIQHKLFVHEYGHTVQSLILGPLFLLAIGLPSLAWAGIPYFRKWRIRKKISYYSFYPELWANKLGYRILENNHIGGE